MIKFSTPDITTAEVKKVEEAIDTRWLTNGPTVREFERRIAKLSRCDRAVAYDSCTGAMEMALRALGIGPGDEVITTPYTYAATAEVIRNVGARIVFVDLGNGFEMDYEKVAEAMTERTKAIMPVDIGGKLCDYQSIMAAAISFGGGRFKPSSPLQEAIGRPAIVADAAHSFRATMDGSVRTPITGTSSTSRSWRRAWLWPGSVWAINSIASRPCPGRTPGWWRMSPSGTPSLTWRTTP